MATYTVSRFISTLCTFTPMDAHNRSTMYNGIGLSTPRGSGTNGYVQKNFAAVKNRREKVEYKSDADLARLDRSLNKQPNKDILEHQWKRGIELKCIILQDELETQG